MTLRRTLPLALAALVLHGQPAPLRFTLPNGLRVVHLADPGRPLVRAVLRLDLAPGDLPPDQPGLVALAARMLEGPGGPRTEALDRELAAAGVRLESAWDPTGLSWHLVARNREQDRAFGLLADLITRPVLNLDALASCRTDCLRDLARREASPRERLEEALLWPASARPTLATLGSLGPPDLLAFRGRLFRPDRALLVLQGDLAPEQARQLVLLAFGAWPPGKAPGPAPLPARTPAPDPPLLLPARGPGTSLRALAPLEGGPSPEGAALLTLLVPGDPLLRPLRPTLVAQGLALAVDLAPDSGQRATWERLLGPLEALARRGFQEADLDRARRAWRGSRALAALDSDLRVDQALAEARGRAPSEARMAALTLADLNGDLRRWLDPVRLRRGAAAPEGALAALATP